MPSVPHTWRGLAFQHESAQWRLTAKGQRHPYRLMGWCSPWQVMAASTRHMCDPHLTAHTSTSLMHLFRTTDVDRWQKWSGTHSCKAMHHRSGSGSSSGCSSCCHGL